eukprot:CAMPEP_0197044084 /NCGR_PEP_ID=MMETSP1384-20130603/20219_1 /TAXON_ID=29189 /ORGANISM="Ammonia sp." /LENGTH=806 /DNA_ID=CAMNT_0042475481 /DNA_START=68 /DNA_END=2488 /DNA_ORIENTATION=+
MISTKNGLTQSQIDYIKSLTSAVIRYYQQFVSIVPVSGNLFFPRVCTDSIETEFGSNCVEYLKPNQCGMVDLPDEHMSEDLLYFTNTTQATKLPAGTGIADTDLVIYVSFAQTLSCGPATLAWAHPCYQDQFGRPIAGNLNICPFMFEAPHYWKQDIVVMLHETTHILIMGPELWDDFRDANGDKIPQSDIVSEQQPDGLYYITAPTVQQFARLHYDCDTLIGFPLEDTGNAGSAGAHWDEKYAMSSLMGSTIWGGLQYMTQFTMALMADSGWYYVDYSFIEPYHFAKNAGCQIFHADCIDPDSGTSNWPQFWCMSPSDNGCNYNYQAPAYCEYYFYDEDLPWQAQYFSDGAHGGPAASDYCPFRDPNTHIYDFEAACWDQRGNSLVPRTYSWEWYGLNSRCVDVDEGSAWNGYCFEHECFGFDASRKQWQGVTIHIDEYEAINCSQWEQPDGAVMTTKYSYSQQVYITCPNIDSICGTTSRPFECFWGNWNDDLSQCVCSAGYVGDQCDTEDRSIGPELLLNNGITKSPTLSPTMPVSKVVCVENFSADWINGEFAFDGIWNFYPIWKNEDGLYIFWNIFSHWWMIYHEADTFHYYAYCNVSEFTPEIMDCNQHWRVYQQTRDTVLEPLAAIHYGACSTPPITTVAGVTPSSSTSTTHVNRPPEVTSSPSSTSTTTTRSTASVSIVSQTTTSTKHTDTFLSTELIDSTDLKETTNAIALAEQTIRSMARYYMVLIGLGTLMSMICVGCFIFCGCRLIKNLYTDVCIYEEEMAGLGGGHQLNEHHRLKSSSVDDESIQFQHIDIDT